MTPPPPFLSHPAIPQRWLWLLFLHILNLWAMGVKCRKELSFLESMTLSSLYVHTGSSPSWAQFLFALLSLSRLVDSHFSLPLEWGSIHIEGHWEGIQRCLGSRIRVTSVCGGFRVLMAHVRCNQLSLLMAKASAKHGWFLWNICALFLLEKDSLSFRLLPSTVRHYFFASTRCTEQFLIYAAFQNS